jgi:hypothetical protein
MRDYPGRYQRDAETAVDAILETIADALASGNARRSTRRGSDEPTAAPNKESRRTRPTFKVRSVPCEPANSNVWKKPKQKMQDRN